MFNLIDNIVNPRAMQRLEEFPCSVCGGLFDFKEDSSLVLNGFVDKDTKELVHLNMTCRQGHYEKKKQTEFSGQYSEFPLTIQDLEVFAQIGIK